MKQAIPLVIAGVLAGVVFLMTTTGPVEACGRAIVTFVVVFFVVSLLTRPRRKR